MHRMKRCPRCYLQECVCLCDEIPRIDTRTRIVIVRHAAEIHKASNSGRLAALALANSAVLDYGVRDAPFDDAPLLEPDTFLLFPAAEPTRTPPRPLPGRLVVLDATWSQARRMHHRIAALRGMPVIALPAPVSPPSQLRTPPHSGGLATIESIARALALLEGEHTAAPLDALYALMIERSIATARHSKGRSRLSR